MSSHTSEFVTDLAVMPCLLVVPLSLGMPLLLEKELDKSDKLVVMSSTCLSGEPTNSSFCISKDISSHVGIGGV